MRRGAPIQRAHTRRTETTSAAALPVTCRGARTTTTAAFPAAARWRRTPKDGGAATGAVPQIERDSGEARAARQEIGRAPRRLQAAAAAHPEQRAQVEPRARGRLRVESIGAVHEGNQAAARCGASQERQQQAAASGGSGSDDLAEPALGEGIQQAI
jgi:hypothetical protein